MTLVILRDPARCERSGPFSCALCGTRDITAGGRLVDRDGLGGFVCATCVMANDATLRRRMRDYSTLLAAKAFALREVRTVERIDVPPPLGMGVLTDTIH